MISSPSPFEVLVHLHSIFLIKISIIIKKLGCSHAYITRTLIRYTMQYITKAWIAVAQNARFQLFYERVSPYCIVIRTRNLFEAVSRNGKGLALRSQADDLENAFGPVDEEGEVAAALWDKLRAVDGAF